ncbi:MAG: sigma-54 dependent transcriptional regulator [Myxococcota bacterium]|nr:sigma-54 dependent transcriptional regulator [Myxococcota bacterium]
MSDTLRLLVVEDNDALRQSLCLALADHHGEVVGVSRGDEAVRRLSDAAEPPFDLVLTDLRLPGVDGLGVVEAALDRDPRTPVLVMTAYGSVDTAVDAMRRGAFDFLEKPVDLDQLEMRVRRAANHRALLEEVGTLRAERDGRRAAQEIIGAKGSLREATDLALRVAPTRSTVLVTGETGTGKELVAELVHRASDRRDGPLVKVNCAALPEPLLESELFGHERGAFTGADRQRKGRFEEASGGTLFLDEVGDLTPGMQAKLLRVLQEQEFHRLGGERTLRTDARIVAATHQDLAAAVREGRFREDLYFRLHVVEIRLPPLRDRPEDLPRLARHFLATLPHEGARPADLTTAAIAKLAEHPWPGNVRELRNAMERALLLARGSKVEAGDFELKPPVLPAPVPGLAAGWTLADAERALVLDALERTGYVQKDASERLGVSRRKLNYMIRRMGITHPSWRRNRGPEPDE